MADDKSLGWKRGPLPPNTWNYGGVVLFQANGKPETGFHWADFKGDRVALIGDCKDVMPHEIAMYNNSLTLPPSLEELP